MSERKPYRYVGVCDCEACWNAGVLGWKELVQPISDAEAVQTTLAGRTVLWLATDQVSDHGHDIKHTYCMHTQHLEEPDHAT